MNRLQEIEARKLEIRTLLESEQDIELEAIDTELRSLEVEKQQIEQRAALAQGIQAGIVPATTIEQPKEERKMEMEVMTKEEVLASAEYRSGYFKLLQGKAITDAEKRALTTAAGSAGAAVPTQTLNSIIDKLRQSSVLFPKVSVSYIGGNVSLVVANAKNAAAWKAEGANGTAADDTVSSVVLNGYELIKLVEISAAAQAMSIDAFEAYIVAELSRQLAIAIENAILNGTGSNQPQGILTGITWTAGSNMVNWAANASVGYDNLLDGVALLPTLYHQNAVLVMNRKTLFGGIRKIKTTYGEPIFTYNPQDTFAGTIFGYNVIVNDYIADDTILFGDLSYYYFNFAQAPQIEASREAAFASGKVTYRGLLVADGKPALAEAFVKISKASS